MEKIPTTEELFKKAGFFEGSVADAIRKVAVQFAKWHVEAALKAATEKADYSSINPHTQELPYSVVSSVYVSNLNGPDEVYFIDKESILSAYPLENIK